MGTRNFPSFKQPPSWRPHRIITVVALFVSVGIIRLRQMAANYRQALGEFLLIIATWAAIVAALIEQGVARLVWLGYNWRLAAFYVLLCERASRMAGSFHRPLGPSACKAYDSPCIHSQVKTPHEFLRHSRDRLPANSDLAADIGERRRQRDFNGNP
jgi:hypothetical protein